MEHFDRPELSKTSFVNQHGLMLEGEFSDFEHEPDSQTSKSRLGAVLKGLGLVAIAITLKYNMLSNNISKQSDTTSALSTQYNQVDPKMKNQFKANSYVFDGYGPKLLQSFQKTKDKE